MAQKNTDKELIVLIKEGSENFLPFVIKNGQVTAIHQFLLDTLSDMKTGLEIVSIPGVYPNAIRVSSIVGWYFRDIVENPADKLIKSLEKQMGQPPEGDGWKYNSDDDDL